MNVTMPTRTLTDRRKVAKRARQYGYFARSEQEGSVSCPLCRVEVTAPRYIDYDKGRYETWPVALDRAMLEHLDPTYPECKALQS